MPFVAMVQMLDKDGRDKDKPKRVNIRGSANPKEEYKGSRIFCQACGGDMFIRHSVLRRPHFVHNSVQDCAYGHGDGQSEKHYAAKDAIMRVLASRPEYRFSRIIEEYHFKSINRIADVLVVHSNKDGEVHEAQLARISPQELEERTLAYRSANIVDVVWWLGGDADNEVNREWCQQYLGSFGVLSFHTDALRFTVDLRT